VGHCSCVNSYIFDGCVPANIHGAHEQEFRFFLVSYCWRCPSFYCLCLPHRLSHIFTVGDIRPATTIQGRDKILIPVPHARRRVGWIGSISPLRCRVTFPFVSAQGATSRDREGERLSGNSFIWTPKSGNYVFVQTGMSTLLSSLVY
jgi:hypothetical protein